MGNNFVDIEYIRKGNGGLCGADFLEEGRKTIINITYILSLSDLIEFTLPISGTAVAYFSMLTMSNGDIYYLNDESYKKLKKEL